MKNNKMNIFVFLVFFIVLVFLIVAQVDFVLGGVMKNYLIPTIIISIICYIVVFGLDVYQRLSIYKALNRLLVIGIAVINLILFAIVITLLPILIHYNLPTNLITAIHSTAISVYAVISGFSVIILNKYYPKI